MTPAINLLSQSGDAFRVHEYKHDPTVGNYGLEAIAALQLDAERVFKTLLVMLEGNPKRLAVGVVPVMEKLDVKALAKAVGAKKAEMADPKQAERITGYLVGGISPLGQKRLLPTVIDESAEQFDSIFVSGGRRGIELELGTAVLIKLCRANYAALCR